MSEPTEGFANRPVTTEVGHGVRIKTFTNQGQHGPFTSTKFERGYKDGEEWKTTDSVGLDDLLPLSLALQDEYRRITLERSKARTR